MQPAAHLVNVDEHRSPPAIWIHGTLEFRGLLVHPPADILVVDRPATSMKLVHHSGGAVTVQEGNPGIACDAIKEGCCRIPHPDGLLVGPVDLRGAKEGDVRLSLAI